MISIDQFRADYLDRFAPWFSPGGFARLRSGGLEFAACHYEHAYTKTAPGHALILSGVHANIHGIVDNVWIDRRTWRRVLAVEDPDSPIVGPAQNRPSPVPLFFEPGRSPRNFQAETVGDILKQRHGGDSRVLSIANKDRSAILMGGKSADAAYWMEAGAFVSSRYYHDALPAWVAAFNAQGRVERTFGCRWELLLEPSVYEAVAGPDDALGEDGGFGMGTTFPKTIDGGDKEIGRAFYEAFEQSPMASEILVEFVIAAVVAENLGRRAATDLLCIGFSQIDFLGHAFGPDSVEMMDAVLRLDRLLARLLSFLDGHMGKGNYLVVLTADHGVAPLPERMATRSPAISHGRLDWPAIEAGLDAALSGDSASADQRWFVRDGMGFHLVPETLAQVQVSRADGETRLRQALQARPEFRAAFTRTELQSERPLGPLGEAVRLSYHEERSPDVVYVLNRYFVDRRGSGSNHGTPYDYDTHVPLLWYGRGVPQGVRGHRRVGMQDIAPTLAALLQVPRPPQSTGSSLFDAER
ncbi:MAG: alkaline phosphatase family protein [Opitutaceae bacterium]|nr:alkaline phosphatase family protein [Opitutaceae bacterium]